MRSKLERLGGAHETCNDYESRYDIVLGEVQQWTCLESKSEIVHISTHEIELFLFKIT